MSEKTLGQIADRIREAASTVAWRQWASLGSLAASEKTAQSMIDPEALVLVTLTLSSFEKRFWDVLTAWSAGGVRLLSVQRMKNLASSYPESTRSLVAEYAFLAHKVIGDQRWKSLYKEGISHTRALRGKRWEAEPDLLNDPVLMLRLRRGIGVNMRADVLSLLLAIHGEAMTVRQLAEALRYTNAATRRAAEDLASAQLIHVLGGAKPDTYAVDPKSWSRVLGLSGLPPQWRRWQDVFEFVANVVDWDRSSRESRISQYALAALGNELTEKHSRVFEYSNEIASRGRRIDRTRTADSFEARTVALCDWMVEHA